MILETERLILRPWGDDDYEPFAELNADSRVMEYFPRLMTREESDAQANTIRSLIDERGWGMWACELKATAEFTGFTGLHTPSSELPFSPCVEVGWRLAHRFWNHGLATEAALKSLQFAFENLDLAEVVAFAVVGNLRSRAVMQKIGMVNTGRNFIHPDIPHDSPLREHVLYKIAKSDWTREG